MAEVASSTDDAANGEASGKDEDSSNEAVSDEDGRAAENVAAGENGVAANERALRVTDEAESFFCFGRRLSGRLVSSSFLFPDRSTTPSTEGAAAFSPGDLGRPLGVLG